MPTSPPSVHEDIWGVIRLSLAFLTALFFLALSILVLTYDVSLFGLSGVGMRTLAMAFFVVATLNIGALAWREFQAADRGSRIQSLLFALSSIVPASSGFILVANGPQGRGTAASGVGFLIGLIVFCAGLAGASLTVWYACRRRT